MVSISVLHPELGENVFIYGKNEEKVNPNELHTKQNRKARIDEANLLDRIGDKLQRIGCFQSQTFVLNTKIFRFRVFMYCAFAILFLLYLRLFAKNCTKFYCTWDHLPKNSKNYRSDEKHKITHSHSVHLVHWVIELSEFW